MSKIYKVSVVILNYKSKDLILKCLKSVLNSDYKNLQITIVDNDSKDDLEAEVNKFPEVLYIQNSQNLGYTGGNNIGIKKALDSEADYIFILNPDTTILKDTISKLVKGSEKYNAGIVTPKIYFDQSRTIWYAGKIIDLNNVLASHIGVDQEDQGQFDKDLDILDVTGAAMLIKREVFERIGLFDERYFLYYEESDLSFRAKKANFKLMYIYSAVVYHKNAQSTGLGSPLQDYFITRNRMLFASKFLPLRTRFALFREGLRNLGNKTKRMAFIDFLLGKFGKGSFLK